MPRHCKVCRKTADDLKKNKNVCDRCLSLRVSCPIHGRCSYQHPKYSVDGRPRKRVEAHTAEDQVLSSGSIIHWSSPVIRINNLACVLVTCKVCQRSRPMRISKIMDRVDEFTGCHKECWRRADNKIRPNYGLIENVAGGYRAWHRNVFAPEMLSILEPMFSKDYVLEHRAVMALRLGRPLLKEEIVHHLDGDRSNNEFGNLRLLHTSKHHKGHGDDFYQPYQETLSFLRIVLPLVGR